VWTSSSGGVCAEAAADNAQQVASSAPDFHDFII